MSKITEEEIQKILPVKGPSFEEVKNYLKKYNNEYIIIKCGGSVLVDQDLFNNFINDISILNKLGFIPIIIHGGGKRISVKLNEAGIKSNFINGLRVTDEKSINIVEEVLNTFNKDVNKTLNDRLNRTEFMPFAPVVLDSFAKKYFPDYHESIPAAKYMTITYDTREDFKDPGFAL